jgi:purine-nucleoside phosphorylase
MAIQQKITMSLYDKIQATAAYISARVKNKPQVAIILGSGLGGLIHTVQQETEVDYNDIPGFPQATVAGHEGKLVFGKLGGKDVAMLAGRFHYYEGYNMEQITFPVRVMKALGVETLIVSNAAGGMNTSFKVGDLMIIRDHINLFPEHPLRGPNDERLGTRFPDMSHPYDQQLIDKALDIASKQELTVHTGVYAGLTGPTFETKAEYKWLHIIGADAVGMSTVPEVIVAVHGGMRVFATSIITDMGIGDHLEPVSHEEVLAAANEAAPKLAQLVTSLIATI